MSVPVDILSGVAAFKSMYDAAKALKDMNDAAVRNAAVIELQRQILDTQEQQATLLQRKSELEAEVAALKAWEAEKERYELVSLAPNMVAYAEKRDLSQRTTPHYLCANCFNQGKKSHLQQIIHGDHLDRFRCNPCGEELSVNKNGPPRQAMTNRNPGGPGGWMNR